MQCGDCSNHNKEDAYFDVGCTESLNGFADLQPQLICQDKACTVTVSQMIAVKAATVSSQHSASWQHPHMHQDSARKGTEGTCRARWPAFRCTPPDSRSYKRPEPTPSAAAST